MNKLLLTIATALGFIGVNELKADAMPYLLVLASIAVCISGFIYEDQSGNPQAGGAA